MIENYELHRKNIKRISLRIDNNGIIKVSAPYFISKNVINNFVSQNKKWIEKKLDSIVKYNDGCVIYYLGKPYIIKNIYGNTNKLIESSFKDNILYIYLKNINDNRISRNIIFQWYKEKSSELLKKIINKYKFYIKREVNSIKLRAMTTRWGSCNYVSANITLNIKLLGKDILLVEYVLLHELIHLIHPNHGINFYKTLDLLMPNWRELNMQLKDG